MRNVSDTYRAQMTTGFQVVSVVQILQGGIVKASSDDLNNPHPFSVIDGSVSVDATASFRRTLSSLKIVDPTGYWRPDSGASLLSVTSGAELYVRSGMMVNGKPELFDQGYFGIQTSHVVDSPAGGVVIEIGGSDRGRQVSRNKITGLPYIVLPNINMTDAVITLLQNRMPNIKIRNSFPTTHVTAYRVLDEQADPWTEAQAMLDSIGYEIFFAADGWCVIKPIPDINDPTNILSWVYQEGVNAIFLDMGRSQDNQDIYSGQTVTGASTYGLTPARAVVWDDDPLSPTYYLGPYGQVMNFTQSDLVAYTAQATDMAAGLIRKGKGLSEINDLNIVPNYAHETEDIIQVTRAASGLSNVKMFIDKMTIPLIASGSQKMPITCRKRSLS